MASTVGVRVLVRGTGHRNRFSTKPGPNWGSGTVVTLQQDDRILKRFMTACVYSSHLLSERKQQCNNTSVTRNNNWHQPVKTWENVDLLPAAHLPSYGHFHLQFYTGSSNTGLHIVGSVRSSSTFKRSKVKVPLVFGAPPKCHHLFWDELGAGKSWVLGRAPYW